MTIYLQDLWPIESHSDYKIHFARWNGHSQPLDVWTRSKAEWQGWQEYWPGRNDFNREYIFSLMHFYHETDIWLFGGVYRVLDRLPDRYVVEITEIGEPFIGRLKIHCPYRDRTTRTALEKHVAKLKVSEILREPYSGRAFPGYEDIDLTFEELETLVRNDRPEWKAALESVKGIYLISDTKTGLRYVGSAYGDQGIWSRWRSYVETGHGGNVELRTLVSDPNLQYCRANFRIALLEHRPARTADEIILAREGFWKRLLLTRGKHGLNRN